MIDPVTGKLVPDPVTDRTLDISTGAMAAAITQTAGRSNDMSAFAADQAKLAHLNERTMVAVKAVQGLEIEPLAKEILSQRSAAAQPFVPPTPVVVAPPVKTA